jgi:hypothetical protein
MFVATMTAIAESQIRPIVQPVQTSNQTPSASIHIALAKNIYAAAEKPIAVMTIQNISSNEIWFSDASYLYRVHVTSADGEPPKTELHRHMLGDVRPGDGPYLRSDSGGRPIAPGSVTSQKFDLSAFYDLSKPGDYSVYLEIYDPAGPKDGSGRWLRTNTVKFEIKAPS